jgi:hypothetical protein
MSTYSVYSQSLSLSKRKREPKWQSRMSNPERTEHSKLLYDYGIFEREEFKTVLKSWKVEN